jgi:hypothetical protein
VATNQTFWARTHEGLKDKSMDEIGLLRFSVAKPDIVIVSPEKRFYRLPLIREGFPITFSPAGLNLSLSIDSIGWITIDESEFVFHRAVYMRNGREFP